MRKWEPKGGPKTEQNRLWMICGPTLGAEGAEKGGSKMVPKMDLIKGGFWRKSGQTLGQARRNVRRSWALFLADFKQDLARNLTRSAPSGAADSVAPRIPPGQGLLRIAALAI